MIFEKFQLFDVEIALGLKKNKETDFYELSQLDMNKENPEDTSDIDKSDNKIWIISQDSYYRSSIRLTDGSLYNQCIESGEYHPFDMDSLFPMGPSIITVTDLESNINGIDCIKAEAIVNMDPEGNSYYQIYDLFILKAGVLHTLVIAGNKQKHIKDFKDVVSPWELTIKKSPYKKLDNGFEIKVYDKKNADIIITSGSYEGYSILSMDEGETFSAVVRDNNKIVCKMQSGAREFGNTLVSAIDQEKYIFNMKENNRNLLFEHVNLISYNGLSWFISRVNKGAQSYMRAYLPYEDVIVDMYDANNDEEIDPYMDMITLSLKVNAKTVMDR